MFFFLFFILLSVYTPTVNVLPQPVKKEVRWVGVNSLRSSVVSFNQERFNYDLRQNLLQEGSSINKGSRRGLISSSGCTENNRHILSIVVQRLRSTTSLLTYSPSSKGVTWTSPKIHSFGRLQKHHIVLFNKGYKVSRGLTSSVDQRQCEVTYCV